MTLQSQQTALYNRTMVRYLYTLWANHFQIRLWHLLQNQVHFFDNFAFPRLNFDLQPDIPGPIQMAYLGYMDCPNRLQNTFLIFHCSYTLRFVWGYFCDHFG